MEYELRSPQTLKEMENIGKKGNWKKITRSSSIEEMLYAAKFGMIWECRLVANREDLWQFIVMGGKERIHKKLWKIYKSLKGISIPKLIDDIVNWIKRYCEENGITSLVVGVSGGIDSAVVARLCEKTGIRTICVSMPYDTVCVINGKEPEEGTSTYRSFKLCQNRNVEYYIIQIKDIVQAYKFGNFTPMKNGELLCGNSNVRVGDTQLSEGNLRSRIRANILYDFAGKNNGIVVGTGNKDEDQIGYATVGGDFLCDIFPLSDLHKSIVYKIAKEWEDIPQSIIDAVPTAELWDGQTDEGELGMTYDEIAWAIDYDDNNTLCKYLTPRKMEVLLKVREMRKKNKHKITLPPVFKFYPERYSK